MGCLGYVPGGCWHFGLETPQKARFDLAANGAYSQRTVRDPSGYVSKEEREAIEELQGARAAWKPRKLGKMELFI